MLVRRASTKDIRSLMTLTSLVADKHGASRPDIFIEHPYHITQEKLERDLLSDNHIAFVAEINGIIVGVLLCTIQHIINDNKKRDSIVLRVEDTCVSPQYRRRSIGTALLAAAKEVAREKNCQRIESNVWSFNTESLSFFEKNGFKVQRMTMEWLNDE